MARRNEDLEGSTDDWEDRTRPEPRLPNPGREGEVRQGSDKPLYADPDRLSSMAATLLLATATGFVILLIIIAAIKLWQWLV